MKILFLSDNFFPETNAAASRVYERALFWVREGHEVTVITCCPNFPEGKPFKGYKNRWRQVETIEGIRVVRVKSFMSPNQGVVRRMLDFASFMLSSLFFSFFEPKPDVVMASSPQFFTAISGYFVSLFKRTPYGLEIADLWPESIRAVGAMKDSVFLDVMEKIELFLYRNATFIVTLTHSIKANMVRRGVEPNKITTVINGVNLEFFKEQSQPDSELERQFGLQDKFVVGYIGTFGMAHNLCNLLKAAELLQKAGNDKVHFLVVGGGAEKEKLNQYKRSQLLNNVTIVGRQPKSEIRRYWSLCDVALVHLKNSETFKTVIPSKIFEAMAMGKAILYCGPESDGSQIVTKESTGVRVDSDNPAKLKVAIEQLSEDSLELDSFRKKSLEAAPRYSRKQQAEILLKLMTENLCSEQASWKQKPQLRNR